MSLQVSPQAAAVELLRRRKARANLQEFICYLNPDYIVSDFSITVCSALDDFIVSMAAGRRPILCLTAPPQHGKTDIVSRYLPAYLFGINPNLRVGGLSYGAQLAARINRDVQAIMMDEAYARLFPDTALNDKRVVTADSQARRNTEMFEIVGNKGSYVAQGVGGPLTGYSLDLGIIDDPIKNGQEARSKTVKDSIWSWYVSTFLTRLSKNSGQIIMATRWALDDLTGRVLEAYPQAKLMKFQAIDEDGKALVPELHPIEKLLEYKKTLGDYFWAAMYQSSPIPDGGGDFKVDNIQIVDAFPAGLKFIRGWDLAATVKKTSDYTASAKLGRDATGVIWVDVERSRGSPDEVERKIIQTAQVDGSDTKQSIPRDPGQAGFAQAANLSKKLQGFRFEFTPESGDKRSRAAPFAAQVNAGNVRLLRGSYNKAFLDELRIFPNGEHDDMVDACSRAYNDLITNSRYTLDNL